MSLKNGNDLVLTPGSAPLARCENCSVSILTDRSCDIVETDVAKLRVAGEEGCQVR